MNLTDLYEKQEKEKEKFNALRFEAWQKVYKDNQNLAASFGGKDKLNETAQKTYDSRINSFNAEWSSEGGTRYNAMLDQHKKERENLTGKPERPVVQNIKLPPLVNGPEKTTKDKFQNQSQNMTKTPQQMSDAQKEAAKKAIREKIAKQQAAIKAKKLEKKAW